MLAVTLVPGLRVHTLALFADLRPEQYALVDVAVGWNAVVHDVVVLCVTLSVRAEAVELS